MTQPKLILASSSPFRQKLLKDAGFTFEAIIPTGDEKTISGLPPPVLATKRAEFKGIDVARHLPADRIVIGADQVLGFEGTVFDKATTSEQAEAKLKTLQGKTHHLYSAFCLVKVNASGSLETIYEGMVDIPMVMRRLTDSEIAEYVALGEWEGCVGGYRIEGQGRKLFQHVTADQSAIIGLPMPELIKALKSAGVG
jgi:septum formation protein